MQIKNTLLRLSNFGVSNETRQWSVPNSVKAYTSLKYLHIAL